MHTPQFLIKPTQDQKPYRLRCRFKTDPYPTKDRLDREKVKIAETFVVDMHKQGWEHDGRFDFEMTGPFPMITPVTIRPCKMPAAREMLPYILSGATFRDSGENSAVMMPTLALSEGWEYEIAGIFVRPQIMTEYADRHEEQF